jgi:DNA-binding MarR family transcriptional regulator
MRHTATPRPPLTDAEYRVLAGFRHTLRRFFAFSEDVAVSVGLTPQQYQALLAIRSHPAPEAMTVGDLANQLFIRHHSAVGLVDRLEGRGLVVRQDNQRDRRVVCLVLTMRGESLLRSLAATHRAELLRMRSEVIGLLESLGD